MQPLVPPPPGLEEAPEVEAEEKEEVQEDGQLGSDSVPEDASE